MAALTEAVFAIDARTGLVNLGTGGTALTPTSGSTSGADSNDPTYLAHTGTNYVYLPGGANVISVPDAAALDITGDIDIRACLAADDWTPTAAQAIVTKYGGAGSRSYYLRLNTAGTLSLLTSADGTAVNTFTSTVATGLADGATKWVRATLDVDNGASGKTATFFLSDDGSTWTQLGTAVTTAGTTSIFNSTAGLQVGAVGTSTDPLAARVFRAQVFNGIGGTLVYDADLSHVNTGAALAAPLTGTVATDLNASYVSNLGTLGLAAPGRPGSGTGVDTNDPIWLQHTGTNYLYLPGATGNYASVPDPTQLAAATELDVRIAIAADDWTPSGASILCAQGPSNTASTLGFVFYRNTDGTLQFATSDGATRTDAAASSLNLATNVDGSLLAVRVTWRSSDGRVQYWWKVTTGPTAASDTASNTGWTSLGADRTAGTVALNNPAEALSLGAYNTGNNPTAGKIYVGQVATTIDGVPFLTVDFTTGITSGGATSFTATTGQTVTINRSTSGRKSVAVVKPVWLFGTDDFMEFPDQPEFNFGASESFSVVMAVRRWTTLTNQQTFMAKVRTVAGVDNEPGWLLRAGFSTGAKVSFSVQDTVKANKAEAESSNSMTSGSVSLMAAVRNVASDTVSVTFDGTTTSVTDTTTGSFSNDLAVRIGRLASSGTSYADMEFFGAAVFRRALSAAEITTLNDYYVNGGSVAAAEALLATAVLWVDANKSRAQAAIVRATSGRKAVAVTRPVWLFGTDDYLEVADNALLDFGASDSFTVMACGRFWNTQGTNDTLVAKKANTTNMTQGWSLSNGSSTALGGQTQIGDGSAGITATSASRTAGTLTTVTMVRNVGSDNVTVYTGGTAGTSVTDTTTATLANSEVMRIGRLSGAGTEYADMELFAVAIWRRALSAAEIAEMSTALTNAVLRPTVPDELALTLNTQAGDLLLASQPNDVVLHTTPKGLVLE